MCQVTITFYFPIAECLFLDVYFITGRVFMCNAQQNTSVRSSSNISLDCSYYAEHLMGGNEVLLILCVHRMAGILVR